MLVLKTKLKFHRTNYRINKGSLAESRSSDLPQTGIESWNNVSLVNSPEANSDPIAS